MTDISRFSPEATIIIYTLSRKKYATFFSTITLAILVDFYNFYTIENNEYPTITYNVLT